MGMTFNKGSFYPSDAKKKKKKKPKISEKEYEKSMEPVEAKKEGSKKELAMEQIEKAISSENIGYGEKLTKKVLEVAIDAAADDKQLTRTERSMSRHGVSPYKHYKGGGMATRGLGRAFMKGGKV